MLELEKWTELSKIGYKIFTIDYLETDRLDLMNYFLDSVEYNLPQFNLEEKIPIYYWNEGSKSFNKVIGQSLDEIRLEQTKKSVPNERLLERISSMTTPGIFLIEDWLTDDLSKRERSEKESRLQNFHLASRRSAINKIVFFLVKDYYPSNKISALIPSLKYSLPDAVEVGSYLAEKMALFPEERDRYLDIKSAEISLLGLSRGEIRYAIDLWSRSGETFSDFIYNYKIARFRDLGLEFIAAPDVEKAGGLDNLQQYFAVISQLNEIEASDYGLSPPKGMLLLGVPGTGKTLCAKLAAQMLNYSLMGFSWGNILGADNSDLALSKILEIADTIDRVVLLADDFDKGFTGWTDGGVSMRLSQKLLTWMNEHTSRVLMIATVNRIGLLPAELKRRFDDGGIWFVDLPSIGEMHDIFKMYLAKYFPSQFGSNKNPWDNKQWYKLLKQYRGSTPVEIKNAIIRCATEKYCNLKYNFSEQNLGLK